MELLNKGQAARCLKISVVTLDRLVKAGELCPTKIGSRVLFEPEAIQQFIDQHTQKEGLEP